MKYDLNTCRDFYQGKRVLVTGHTGFKGSWLCRILTLAGAQVTGYAAEAPTDPALFSIAGLADTMDSVIGDRAASGGTAHRAGFLQGSGLHL